MTLPTPFVRPFRNNSRLFNERQALGQARAGHTQ
jgi:hypothetical protein